MNRDVGNLEVFITKDADLFCGFDNVKVKLTLLNRTIYEKECVDIIGPHHIVKFVNIPIGHYDMEVSCKGYLNKKDCVHVKFHGPDTHWNGHFRRSKNYKSLLLHKEISKTYNLSYTIDHIPKDTSHRRRPGHSMVPDYLTIHSTGNSISTAKNEKAWLTNSANNRTASFHLVVDETEAIECIPLNEVAWHAGDGVNGTGNRKSIGLEICESGDRTKTLSNAVSLTAKILRDKGWGAVKLKQHHDWTGKNCPRILIDPDSREFSYQTWEWFITQVSKCI